jgi:outer membrane protein TolC
MESSLRAYSIAILRVVIGFGLVLVLIGIARGEKQKEEKLVLTLQQLMNMAIEKSPEIGEGQSEIVAARSELEQVKGGYYPRVESIALVGPAEDAKRPVVAGTRIYDPSPEGIGIFGRFDFTVSQSLYTFGKLSNRKEAAIRGVRVKEHKLLEKKYEIVLRVKQLYYALILARAGIDAAGEATAFFDDARNRMTRLLELGSPNVTESDLYRIDAYRADTIRSRAEAEKGVKVTYFALKSLINLPPGAEFEVREKTLAMEEVQADLRSYIQRALEERPEFKQLEEALAAQESLTRAVRSDLYPSFFVALEGSLAGAPNRETLHNAYIPDEFNHANIGVVAGLKWNFDFSLSPKVDKEQAEYQKLLHTRATGRLNIPIQVAKSYQEVQEWKVAVDAYNKAAIASRKWVVTALVNFDMGVGTADDILRGIEKYGQNQGKYLEALFNYNLSLAELNYAAGMKDW